MPIAAVCSLSLPARTAGLAIQRQCLMTSVATTRMVTTADGTALRLIIASRDECDLLIDRQ